MKHLEIWIDGRVVIKKGSGFAILLLSQNDRWLRSFAYGKYSVNQVDLLALKFGLLSIANPWKHIPIKVYTKNKYIIDMFEKKDGFYVKRAVNNTKLIEEIRELIELLNIEFNMSDGDKAEIVKKAVHKAINENNLVNIKN